MIEVKKMNSKVLINGHLKSLILRPPLRYFSSTLILTWGGPQEEDAFMVPDTQDPLYLRYSLRAMYWSA